MNIPETLRYTKQHQWVSVADNTATIGITEHALKELGDVLFVELPQVDDSLAAGEPLGSVESIKAVSEVYMPIAGKVKEVNEALPDMPDKINEDPYGQGWLIRISIQDSSELDSLMTAQQYGKYIAEESGKD